MPHLLWLSLTYVRVWDETNLYKILPFLYTIINLVITFCIIAMHIVATFTSLCRYFSYRPPATYFSTYVY